MARKKQSGGSGQFGRVEGHEPIEDDNLGAGGFEFESHLVGSNIPPDFVPAIKKGFEEAIEKGPLAGYPVLGMRVVLKDGAAHAVDSNEIAFRLAAQGAFKQAMEKGAPQLLEPIMSVEVQVPVEFQGAAIGQIAQRKDDQRVGGRRRRRAVRHDRRRRRSTTCSATRPTSRRDAGQGRVRDGA